VIPAKLVWPRGTGTKQFLANTWQQEPLRMPSALPGFHSPLSPDELAGLACDDNIESRLVLHRSGSWILRNGPFAESDLQELATSDWSLLVQDVEKHLPDLARILDPFRFLPSWRMDDLMVSCAAAGGSVGPHVDAYDVFLVQAQGRRRWQWDSKTRVHQTREDSELSLVQEFTPDQDWITEPGDVLYLPPGVAHFGVALPGDDLCMTYSVGFRAPSRSEMLQDLAFHLAETADPRYTDPRLDPEESRDGLICATAIHQVRNIINQALSMDDDSLARWFGSFVTEPKAWLKPVPSENLITTKELIRELESGAILRRHGMALWARWRSPDRLMLFVDGRAMEIAPELDPVVAELCSSRDLNIQASVLRASAMTARLITDLLNSGELEIDYGE
jgi:50S ribosomal protein L16 3-hydroxylase